MQFQGKDFPKYTYGIKCVYYFWVIYSDLLHLRIPYFQVGNILTVLFPSYYLSNFIRL